MISGLGMGDQEDGGSSCRRLKLCSQLARLHPIPSATPPTSPEAGWRVPIRFTQLQLFFIAVPRPQAADECTFSAEDATSISLATSIWHEIDDRVLFSGRPTTTPGCIGCGEDRDHSWESWHSWASWASAITSPLPLHIPTLPFADAAAQVLTWGPWGGDTDPGRGDSGSTVGDGGC
jgi:hypothetical protein